MNSKAPIYMFVASVVVAVGMLVFAVNRSSSQEGELTGQQSLQQEFSPSQVEKVTTIGQHPISQFCLAFLTMLQEWVYRLQRG